MIDRDARRSSADRGSVLILMPAAVLVVVVLGALAVDFAALHMAKRELAAVAAGAANDVATAALDLDRYREVGAYELDRAQALELVERRLHAGPGEHIVIAALEVEGRTVRLVLEQRVDPIFARALPGHRTMTVRASAVATTSEASGS